MRNPISGFIYVRYCPCIAQDIKSIFFYVKEKAYKKDSQFFENGYGKNTNNVLWETQFKKLAEYCERKLFPRIQKTLKWIEKENQKTLAKYSQEENKRFLCKTPESSSLYWYECLPYGISLQDAVNATGTTIYKTHYSGNQIHHETYTPNKKMSKQHRALPKI